MDNSAKDETLSHVHGTGGFLRHTGAAGGAAPIRRPRGDQNHHTQTGAKNDTVEHSQPAGDTVSDGEVTSPRQDKSVLEAGVLLAVTLNIP